jgi:hypothetical protein
VATTKQQPIEEPLVRLLQEWLEGVAAQTANDSADYRTGYIAGFSCAADMIQKHRENLKTANTKAAWPPS